MKRMRTSGATRQIILVDDNDVWALDYTWFLNEDGYAFRKSYQDGVQKTFFLAREIMGLGKGDKLEVDHINGVRWDNRRSNLRVVTHAQNTQNRRPDKGSSSRFRGVTWMKANKKWQAQVVMGGKMFYLGLFENEEDAAKIASDFRKQYMPFAVEEGVC